MAVSAARHVGITVTEVNIRFVAEGRLKAYAEVILNGAIRIDNFLIHTRADGRLCVGFPLRPRRIPCPHCRQRTYATLPYCGHCCGMLPGRNGSGRGFQATALPTDQRVHRIVEEAILRAYDTATQGSNSATAG